MFIEGKVCHYCGGAITEIEPPIIVRSDSRMGDDDLKVSRLVPTGKYTSTEVVEYHHVVAGYCSHCNVGFSMAQMDDSDPNLLMEE